MSRARHAAHDEGGQGVLDFLAALVLIALIVSALGLAAPPDDIADGLEDAICRIITLGKDCDTDGDGIPDGEEVLVYGTDPLDPGSGP